MHAIELNGVITAETFDTYEDARLAACDYLAAKYKDGIPEDNKEDTIRFVKLAPVA